MSGLRYICYIPPMPKFDPYKPPLSVEESERLLRKEDERVESAALWKGVGKFVLYAIAIAVVIALSLNFRLIGIIVGVAVAIYAITDISRAERK